MRHQQALLIARCTLWSCLLVLTSSATAAQTRAPNDYHQHLLSPAVANLLKAPKPFTAADLIPLLDQANVQRAVVLSMAYQFGNPNRAQVADEYQKVREENDWTATQASQHPGRLLAFCGVNPLRDYALQEIERCSHSPWLKTGLKLHFGNSDVNLDDPNQVKKLQSVFRAADSHGMAIIVHLHANVDHHRPYGERQARVFLTQVMPFAPHVVIQIAHLAGSGGYDPADDQALAVFVHALADHNPVTNNLYFDIAGMAGVGEWQDHKDLLASRIRAVGCRRILYGTDGSWAGFTPEKGIEAYHQLPLTPAEQRIIDGNVPAYAK